MFIVICRVNLNVILYYNEAYTHIEHIQYLHMVCKLYLMGMQIKANKYGDPYMPTQDWDRDWGLLANIVMILVKHIFVWKREIVFIWLMQACTWNVHHIHSCIELPYLVVFITCYGKWNDGFSCIHPCLHPLCIKKTIHIILLRSPHPLQTSIHEI